jgi:two-component system, OmpR family, sensor kinase
VPIRLRLALLFTIATAVLLAGGGFIYWRQLASGLNASLETSLRSRATALQTEVRTDDANDIHETGPDALLGFGDTIAQVITTSGTVQETSNGLAKKSLLSHDQLLEASRGELIFDTTIRSAPSLGADPEAFRIRLLAAPSGRPGVVVVVGANRDVVDDALHRTTKQLLIFSVFVLVIAASGSYLLARSALRPVDLMRAQAAELDAHDSGAGLKVPKTRDEVSRLAITMNALLGRLHDALSRERTFVADAGHELRTPLTVLRGELELASRPGRSAEQLSRTVAIAAAETKRLIRLSEDLLLMAQADDGMFLRLAPVDVVALAEEAIKAQRGPAAGRGVVLEPPSDEVVVVTADADRIRQALDNLLINSVRFAPAGTSVAVSIDRVTEGGAPAIRVAVTDSGPGFPVAFLPVAFERFRRADTARTRPKGAQETPAASGTGLGLAIVRTIIDAHGGTVSAANNPAGGATVAFTLPLGQPNSS